MASVQREECKMTRPDIQYCSSVLLSMWSAFLSHTGSVLFYFSSPFQLEAKDAAQTYWEGKICPAKQNSNLSPHSQLNALRPVWPLKFSPWAVYSNSFRGVLNPFCGSKAGGIANEGAWTRQLLGVIAFWRQSFWPYACRYFTMSTTVSACWDLCAVDWDLQQPWVFETLLCKTFKWRSSLFWKRFLSWKDIMQIFSLAMTMVTFSRIWCDVWGGALPVAVLFWYNQTGEHTGRWYLLPVPKVWTLSFSRLRTGKYMAITTPF